MFELFLLNFLSDKLVELRNNWLIVMAVTNTLWLILISTLASKGDLTVLGANAIGKQKPGISIQCCQI